MYHGAWFLQRRNTANTLSAKPTLSPSICLNVWNLEIPYISWVSWYVPNMSMFTFSTHYKIALPQCLHIFPPISIAWPPLVTHHFVDLFLYSLAGCVVLWPSFLFHFFGAWKAWDFHVWICCLDIYCSEMPCPLSSEIWSAPYHP